jgi:hypothetical protein
LSGDAIENQQYMLPSNTITIPAGQCIGELTINGIYDGFAGQVDTLLITLSGGNVANFDKTFSLIMQRFCPFDIANFTGNFVCNEVGYGEYLVDITQDPENDMAIIISNFWDWSGELKVVFSGDLSQKLTVPSQTLTMGGDPYLTTGNGNYNGCEGTFSLNTNVGGSNTVQTYYPNITKHTPLNKPIQKTKN